jgi:hypothetical protein
MHYVEHINLVDLMLAWTGKNVTRAPVSIHFCWKKMLHCMGNEWISEKPIKSINRILLEKLTVARLVRDLPAIYAFKH